jgi:hypothetical protein
MSAQQPDEPPRDLHIRADIENDVRDLFQTVFVEPDGEFWPSEAPSVRRSGDDSPGFEPDLHFGRRGVVIAPPTRNDDSDRTHVFMRWRWGGVHLPHPRRLGGRLHVQPTGNWVTVEGLTILEVTGGELDLEHELVTGPDHIYARRLVDWLSVYAQLGLVTEGRPVGMASAMVKPAAEFFGTEPRSDTVIS